MYGEKKAARKIPYGIPVKVIEASIL